MSINLRCDLAHSDGLNLRATDIMGPRQRINIRRLAIQLLPHDSQHTTATMTISYIAKSDDDWRSFQANSGGVQHMVQTSQPLALYWRVSGRLTVSASERNL
jgi:hypothetical protein